MCDRDLGRDAPGALPENCPGGPGAIPSQLRHGVWRFYRTGTLPGCRKCVLGRAGGCERYQADSAEQCPAILDHLDAFVKETMALPHIDETNAHAVAAAGRDLCFLLLCYKHLGLVGPLRMVKGGLSIQPVMRFMGVVENRFWRELGDLGLTPAGRKALGLPVLPMAVTNPIHAYLSAEDAEGGPDAPQGDGATHGKDSHAGR